MQGCHHQARRAKENTRRCPGSSRRSRGATLDISQLRSGWARTQGSCASWRDAGVPPSRQDGFGFATNPRHVGGIEGEGWSYPEPPPARASGGGRSRAATSFACGAGTLWRGFARGLRMTLWPSNPAGRVATGFPLPSMGRGIEGEGWSYPEPPPARASGGGQSRAATPFACGAGTLWRGIAGGLRMTLWPSNPAGRVATGFPLPSMGRGIEGEGWSYPEPPPARASGGGQSRAATPFACGAGTLWRGFARGLRMTLWSSKQPNFPNASLN